VDQFKDIAPAFSLLALAKSAVLRMLSRHPWGASALRGALNAEVRIPEIFPRLECMGKSNRESLRRGVVVSRGGLHPKVSHAA